MVDERLRRVKNMRIYVEDGPSRVESRNSMFNRSDAKNSSAMKQYMERAVKYRSFQAAARHHSSDESSLVYAAQGQDSLNSAERNIF